mgnify:CR=1 FL=1
MICLSEYSVLLESDSLSKYKFNFSAKRRVKTIARHLIMLSRPKLLSLIWSSHVMAPLNVLTASVKVLSKSTRNSENSTSCPENLANHYSICDDSITATGRSKGSSFSSMLSEISTICPQQAHFNKQLTLLNGYQRESIVQALIIIQRLFWTQYAFSFLEGSIAESCYPVSGEARSSPREIDDQITLRWPLFSQYPYSNVSGT